MDFLQQFVRTPLINCPSLAARSLTCALLLRITCQRPRVVRSLESRSPLRSQPEKKALLSISSVLEVRGSPKYLPLFRHWPRKKIDCRCVKTCLFYTRMVLDSWPNTTWSSEVWSSGWLCVFFKHCSSKINDNIELVLSTNKWLVSFHSMKSCPKDIWSFPNYTHKRQLDRFLSLKRQLRFNFRVHVIYLCPLC